jgi:CAAX prenyl protease-like protein
MSDSTLADPPRQKSRLQDDIAYILPMGIFLALTGIGASWESIFPLAYIAKAFLTAIALILLRRHYTRISWKFAWLGFVVGAIGIVQWVGMQHILEQHFEMFRPKPGAFNPFTAFDSRTTAIGFIIIRIASAVLVVPFMEELFWRDFLWRQILAPNDFKLASVGEWGLAPLLIVSGVFATVHGNWWPTAIVWALMIGGLLVYTRSLGACIIAHATTNLLLAIYVLEYHAWSLW